MSGSLLFSSATLPVAGPCHDVMGARHCTPGSRLARARSTGRVMAMAAAVAGFAWSA
jgi:hypothetical protein